MLIAHTLVNNVWINVTISKENFSSGILEVFQEKCLSKSVEANKKI